MQNSNITFHNKKWMHKSLSAHRASIITPSLNLYSLIFDDSLATI